MLQRASKPSLGLHRQMACNHSQCKAKKERKTESERKRGRKEKSRTRRERGRKNKNKKTKTRGEKLITITSKGNIYENQFAVFQEKSRH